LGFVSRGLRFRYYVYVLIAPAACFIDNRREALLVFQERVNTLRVVYCSDFPILLAMFTVLLRLYTVCDLWFNHSAQNCSCDGVSYIWLVRTVLSPWLWL